MATIRSKISLRSMRSGDKRYSRNEAGASESETAIAKIPQSAKLGLRDMSSIDVEAYAMGRVNGENTQDHGENTQDRGEEQGIRRDTHIEQIYSRAG